MSTFCSDELKSTPLTQSITLSQQRVYHVDAISLDLEMLGAPAGTFTASIKSGSTYLGSKSFTSADIQADMSTSNQYGYIKKVLVFDTPVRLKPGTYTVELSASGYTYGFWSCICWIKPHENIFVERISPYDLYTNNPFGVLIYERIREDLAR